MTEYRLAGYALARMALNPYPQDGPATAAHRALVTELAQLRARARSDAEPLSDQLYVAAQHHDPIFRRSVVLPLRRDVHNGRAPRPAVRAQLAELADVPKLVDWLSTMDRIAEIESILPVAAELAIAEERSAIAKLCADDRFGRAITLTSPDLWHAIQRYAQRNGEGSANRKSEPNVVRYTLRAVAKTSPLSWFTGVSWARWHDGHDVVLPTQFHGRTEVARVPVDAVIDALLERDDIALETPHRLAPAVRIDGKAVSFRRDIPVAGSDRVAGHREQAASLPASPTLVAILERVRTAGADGVRPAELVSALGNGASATRYVSQLRAAKLLVPIRPVSIQDTDVLEQLRHWAQEPAFSEIASATTDLATRDASARPEALSELRRRWHALGTSIGASLEPHQIVAEDVTSRDVALFPTNAALDDLRGCAALVDLFDAHHVVRRALRDQFVDTFGPSGVCTRPEEFAGVLPDVLTQMSALGTAGEVADGVTISPELAKLAALRAEVTAQIHAADDGSGEVIIPETLIAELPHALPDWILARPSSLSFFVQLVDSGSLVINHVYAGWGRFMSRFLPGLPPEATEGVAAQIREFLPTDGLAAQFRPVNGFNANLHPMLVDNEVGEDPRWASISPDNLVLTHDQPSDQLRLQDVRSGQLVDVLYLGFLIPYLLPDRLAFLHTDLTSGQTTFDHLVQSRQIGQVRVRPRLNYRSVVLRRKSWDFDAGSALELRSDLGLPEHIYLRAGTSDGVRSVEDFQSYMAAAKPQYVDTGSALHLHCLPKWLRRYSAGLVVEEALPVPGDTATGRRAVELVLETYRHPNGASQ